MPDIADTLVDAAEYVEAWGVKSAVKLRDRREPNYREKTAAELRLMRVMARIFRKQKAKVQAWAEQSLSFAKADKAPMPPDTAFNPDDEDTAELIRQLTEALKGGVSLFGQSVGVQIDYTLTNAEALRYARQYAYDLVANINQTTRDAIQKAITSFIETPGFTIGDAMGMMPFSEERAMRIAVTEITNAYANGQRMAGEELRREFPDVPITKTWNSNADDLVCPVCAPLDGQTVGMDEKFQSKQDNGEVIELDWPAAHVNCRCWASVSTDIQND
jgi:hypothetical protein